MSAVALRPYVPADARRCAEIFRLSIEELAAEDYDADQREAWASTGGRRGGLRRSARGRADPARRDRRRGRRLRQPQGRRRNRHALCRPRIRPPRRRRRAHRGADETRPGARREAPHRRSERGRPAAVRAPRLHGAEAQSRSHRRPMARQHHHDQDPRRPRRRRPNTDHEPNGCPANASICSTRRCATAR